MAITSALPTPQAAGIRRRAAVALAVGVVALATPGHTVASGRHARVVLHPRVGIGPVRLDESQANVERVLGRGHYQRGGGADGGSFRYRTGGVTLYVSYDAGGHVDGVQTHARSVVLFGRALRAGLHALTPAMRAHHWRIIAHCQGETYTFVYPGGPGTGIAWRNGKLDEAFVTGGGSIGEQCLPSHSHPTVSGPRSAAPAFTPRPAATRSKHERGLRPPGIVRAWSRVL